MAAQFYGFMYIYTDTLVSRRSESRAPGGEVWCMTVLLLEITRVVSGRVRVCNYKRPRSSFVGSPCLVLPSCYPARVIEEISTRGFLIRSYRAAGVDIHHQFWYISLLLDVYAAFRMLNSPRRSKVLEIYYWFARRVFKIYEIWINQWANRWIYLSIIIYFLTLFCVDLESTLYWSKDVC